MIRILNIAAIAIILSSCGNGSRELVLAKPEGEVDREIAANLVDLLGNEAAVDITLTKDSMTGGQALEAIVEGRADIALISNDQPFREDIATVMPMYATVLHIVYPADRTAANVAQLLQNATVFAGDDGKSILPWFSHRSHLTDLPNTPAFDSGRWARPMISVPAVPLMQRYYSTRIFGPSSSRPALTAMPRTKQ
jgi:hypothetical protein